MGLLFFHQPHLTRSVFFSAQWAGHGTFINPLAALACPADLPSRIANHERVVRNILCHHGTSADKRITANCMAAYDGAIGAKGRTFFNHCRANLIHLPNFRPWIIDVCENHGRATENAIFQRYTLIDAYIVLYLALVADRNIGTNYNVLADIAARTDFSSRKNV